MSEYNEVVGDLEAVDSNHPVLHKLKQEIADAKNQEQYWRGMYQGMADRYNSEKDQLKNLLLEAVLEHDKDTAVHIAEEMGINLVQEKRYSVTVTFYVDVEEEVGAECNPEWDFDFSVGSNSNSIEIIDYSSDVVSHNEE